MKNPKFSITWTFAQVIKHRVAVDNLQTNPQGVFLWIGSHNSVDRIVGYHFKRGWIADYCYNTRNHWLKDLLQSVWMKQGFIRLTRWI